MSEIVDKLGKDASLEWQNIQAEMNQKISEGRNSPVTFLMPSTAEIVDTSLLNLPINLLDDQPVLYQSTATGCEIAFESDTSTGSETFGTTFDKLEMSIDSQSKIIARTLNV